MNKKMRRKFLVILSTILSALFFSIETFANPMCTVCTIAVVSGLGISRLLGVNDCIIGLWVGACLLAVGQYINKFLSKKGVNNRLLTILAYTAPFLSLVPLYIGKTPVLEFNFDLICGIDSFLFSNVVGVVIIVLSSVCYQYIKKKNGKAHFPFEKVVLPVVSLIFVSVLFYFFKR